MKPDTRTVTELFERDVRYVVPLYQRPYVWDEEHQWQPLWDDITVLLNHLSSPWGADNHYSHFLGAIVLEQETQAPGRIPLYTIIDGQQRLTTLQILLRAASVVAGECGCDDDAGLLQDLVLNDPRKATGELRFKVWPTNANRGSFIAAIDPNGPPAGWTDDPDNLIEEACAYFRERLRAWVNEASDDQSRQERVETIRVALCDLLKIVSITLEPGDNAQVIFETLNARGTPLLALDLVKNAVFNEASKQGLDVDGLYEQVWKPQLDDPYWRRERRQGRLYRAQGELFLMHWLAMRLRRVIPATELFTAFRKGILQADPAPNMADLIHVLCRDAGIMRSFYEQPEGSAEALFFERLEDMDTTTILPLVLYLFSNEEVTAERRRRALAMLESWLVRRTCMRLTAKNYNEQVAVLLGKVSVNPGQADRVICDHLRAGAGEINRWPEDVELLECLTTRDAYGTIAQRRLVMLFSGVERGLYSTKTEALSMPKGLSLEHLMPQAWQKNWPLPSSRTPEERIAATDARSLRIHRLGNLTLVTTPMNTALSNSKWPAKRKHLGKGSKLLLNAEILETYAESFDEQCIDARTLVLAQRICGIWSGPEASSWVDES